MALQKYKNYDRPIDFRSKHTKSVPPHPSALVNNDPTRVDKNAPSDLSDDKQNTVVADEPEEPQPLKAVHCRPGHHFMFLGVWVMNVLRGPLHSLFDNFEECHGTVGGEYAKVNSTTTEV